MKRAELMPQLRSKTLNDLDLLAKNKHRDILKLRQESIRCKIKNSAQIRHLRRDLARIKTVMIEKAATIIKQEMATIKAKPTDQEKSKAPVNIKKTTIIKQTNEK